MSLSKHFSGHVLAIIHLTPAPSTADEVRYLYKCIQRIAAVDFFHIRRDSVNDTYGNILKVAFDTYNRKGMDLFVDPFVELSVDPFVELSVEPASNTSPETTKQDIITTLQQICSVPRFQFIDNDQRYVNNEVEIPFNYKLTPKGLRYENKFTISSSTYKQPFTMITPRDRSVSDFKSQIRFNFEKFTKLDMIQITSNKTTIYKKLVSR